MYINIECQEYNAVVVLLELSIRKQVEFMRSRLGNCPLSLPLLGNLTTRISPRKKFSQEGP